MAGSSDSDLYSAILNFLTAIAALAAVVIAVFSENRAQKRFKQDTERQEKLAAANVRPMLTIDLDNRFEQRQISLRNQGLGTAQNIDLTFAKGNRQSKCRMIDAFDTTYDGPFDSCMRFGDKEENHLRPGGEYVLLLVTRKSLEQQGLSQKQEKIDQIFEALDKQIDGLTIVVNCEDVLGNQQKEFHVTLETIGWR